MTAERVRYVHPGEESVCRHFCIIFFKTDDMSFNANTKSKLDDLLDSSIHLRLLTIFTDHFP